MKLAGHCHRHQELQARRLALWEPMIGRTFRPLYLMWMSFRRMKEMKGLWSWPGTLRTWKD